MPICPYLHTSHRFDRGNRNKEYTALEAAARGQVAMEHNIKDIYEAKRNDPVTAAAGYNALDGDVICVSRGIYERYIKEYIKYERMK